MPDFFITETVTYRVTAPDNESALAKFENSEDRDQFFESVDDREIVEITLPESVA